MRVLHGLKLFFTSAALPMFLASAVSDYAYSASYQIQWMNFSSWLIIGGMVFASLALLVIAFSGARRLPSESAFWLPLVLAAGLWVTGFINAFVHARDAWAMMPTGLALSIAGAVLAALLVGMVFRSAGHGAQA